MPKEIYERIEKTHKGLGRLFLFSYIISKAGKCAMLIAPSGCGKSKVTDHICKIYGKRGEMLDYITAGSLRRLNLVLTNFDGLVVVDDLSKCKTYYRREHTVVTFCELAYSHYYRGYTHYGETKIENFSGSILINVQPILMHDIIGSDEWESSIRDKTFRYYHLLRPIKPNLENFQIVISNKNKDISEIKLNFDTNKLKRLINIFRVQFSLTRIREHLSDVLKAIAMMEGRKKGWKEEKKLTLLKELQM